ncbi:MAG: NERD domain-containing protein [Clostridia bacterium]|nr:NERD domain-containing protein [Clostridia bacterium]MBQ9747043.1 NERD domain-containing protein [Clostridia bacterium]
MEKLTPFVMCAVFVLASFCFWKLAIGLSSLAARKKIMAQKNEVSKEATSVLLLSHFGEFAVLPNIWLPMRVGKFTLYSKVDNIIILPSCIAVIHVESMRGQIFGGNTPIWHQSVRLPNGKRKENDFENPVVSNEKNIIALTKIFEREKISTPPVYNIIIFSSNKVLFSEDSAEVYSLSAAIMKLKALAKGKKLPFKERSRLRRVIKKYSVSPKKARTHNMKVQRALSRPEPKNKV